MAMYKILIISIIFLVVAALIFLVILRLFARERPTEAYLEEQSNSRMLVVLVHGLAGYNSLDSTAALIRESLPDADVLRVDYKSGPISNVSPYSISNIIELEINRAYQQKQYDEIILVGHSLGGMLTRKALLWGYGIEEDRLGLGRRGKRDWVDKVSRFVSLASVNRGWSIDPKPEKMRLSLYIKIALGRRIAKLTGVGSLAMNVERGTPFIADSRVQWIKLARSLHSLSFPLTIHLQGDQDDIVSRLDSMDVAAAKNTVFVTIPQTGHLDIAQALDGDTSGAAFLRRDLIRAAIQGNLEKLDTDKLPPLHENFQVERIVYLMHGIRDYGEWTDRLRQTIESSSTSSSKQVVVVNKKYGYFPMLPFLFYSDRQKNVRRFMDEYTENLARYPLADSVDFVGHSNGTYILAGALQRYTTLNVERVFFAGSVVPKHYPWRDLIDKGRVKEVVNVVAAGDWVVALFPRFFEQLADWSGRRPLKGALDIGSAGFRGFEDAQDALGRVRNLQYAEGQHGAGVDADNHGKLTAISDYILEGNTETLAVFIDAKRPWRWLDFLSNISWSVWILLITTLIGLGALVFRINLSAGVAYVLILLALLNSV